MAKYDAVAMIDYVKAQTGSNQVGYIGHSMATTVMYYLGITQPDYIKESVSVFVALGPVAYPTHVDSGLVHVMV